MTFRPATFAAIVMVALLHALPASAHVPFLEEQDFSAQSPFIVEDVENSKSLHGTLESSDDYDVFMISLETPARLYTTTNIPFCPQYETFSVTYACLLYTSPSPRDS